MYCYIYCPEGSIRFNKEDGPSVDLEYCKGCGICESICPSKAIEMRRETHVEEE